MRYAALAAAILLVAATTASSTTIHVPGDQPTIQAGIDAAAEGDTVLVGAGTYSDATVRTISASGGDAVEIASCAFLGPGIALRSEAGPTSTFIVLNGHPTLPRWTLVRTAASSSPTIMEGFTIRGGKGGSAGLLVRSGETVVEDCRFENLTAQPSVDSSLIGAGIRALEASLEVANCFFQSCEADVGGAIHLSTRQESRVSLVGSRVEDCSGGALYFGDRPDGSFAQVQILDCELVANRGGAITTRRWPRVTIQGCLIQANSASSVPGVVWIYASGSTPNTGTMVRHNRFVENEGPAAALQMDGCGGSVRGNLFYGNRSAGAVLYPGARSVRNPTSVIGNVFTQTMGAALTGNWNVSATCNLFWKNEGGDLSGSLTDSRSLFLDPQLCAPDEYDFTVASSSPCLVGNTFGACGQLGPEGEGCAATSERVITLATQPPGLVVSREGQEVPSPDISSGSLGTTIEIGASAIQEGSASVRYVFDAWSDGGQPSHSVTVTDLAHFYEATYQTEYFVTVEDREGGTVSPGSAWLPPGTVYTLTATPEPGYRFVRWLGTGRGAYSGPDPVAVITVIEPIRQIPIFEREMHTLTMVAETGGAVSPASGLYDAMSTVQIEAFPDGAHLFVGWEGTGEGSYSGRNRVATVVMTDAITERARFRRLDAGYDFTISASDEDPYVQVSAPSGGNRNLYLWMTCNERGLSAMEGDVSGSLEVLGFTPLSGVLNIATDGNLLLAVPGCPTGTDVNTLIGYWTVLDTGGTLCLAPSAASGTLGAVDCSLPDAFLWEEIRINGFSSAPASPCVIGAHSCQLGYAPTPVLLSSFTAQPRNWGVLLSWSTSFEDLHDGFNVYRSESLASGFTLVNDRLVRGRSPYSYLDSAIRPSTTYYYKLGAIDIGGTEELYDPISVTTPAWGIRPALAPGAPNPFSKKTTLAFSLPANKSARVVVYDVAGRLVRTVIDDDLLAGDHVATWDARDHAGQRVAGGTYFVRLQAGGETMTRKVVFLGE